MIKWVLKKFKCTSSCSFNDNNNIFDCPNFRESIDILNNNFEINNKDILKIFKIIKTKKRRLNSFEIYDKNNNNVTEI